MAENDRDNILKDDERQYIEMLQGNIERMASNSANCKTWMLTIVSALMALQCSISDLNGWIFLVVLPILLFWYLDVYYLHLERGMRNRQTAFMYMFKNGLLEDYKKNLFTFEPYMITKKDLTEDKKSQGLVATNDRWFTSSAFPFYGITLVAVAVISVMLNWSMISEWFCNCGCIE